MKKKVVKDGDKDDRSHGIEEDLNSVTLQISEETSVKRMSDEWGEMNGHHPSWHVCWSHLLTSPHERQNYSLINSSMCGWHANKHGVRIRMLSHEICRDKRYLQHDTRSVLNLSCLSLTLQTNRRIRHFYFMLPVDQIYCKTQENVENNRCMEKGNETWLHRAKSLHIL